MLGGDSTPKKDVPEGKVAGASGAIGSTYNFAAPLYLKLIQAWQNDDLAEAQRLHVL